MALVICVVINIMQKSCYHVLITHEALHYESTVSLELFQKLPLQTTNISIHLVLASHLVLQYIQFSKIKIFSMKINHITPIVIR